MQAQVSTTAEPEAGVRLHSNVLKQPSGFRSLLSPLTLKTNRNMKRTSEPTAMHPGNSTEEWLCVTEQEVWVSCKYVENEVFESFLWGVTVEMSVFLGGYFNSELDWKPVWRRRWGGEGGQVLLMVIMTVTDFINWRFSQEMSQRTGRKITEQGRDRVSGRLDEGHAGQTVKRLMQLWVCLFPFPFCAVTSLTPWVILFTFFGFYF